MLTTGVDIIEVERIKKIMENARFFERMFTAEEQKLFAQRGWNPQVVAGNFAAKEALVKALDTQFGRIDITEVSVLRNEMGAPYYLFTEKALALVAKQRLKFSLSISNTPEYVVAFTVCYQEGPPL